MQVQLITPEKIFFSGTATLVKVPGASGEFGVLAGHAPLVSSLAEGEVVIELENGESKSFTITGGIVEVTAERCTLLVEKVQ
jgi:F-type H+-transporting ATPase subunit epsilon